MRSIIYVAGLVAAIAIGMYQGPRESRIATRGSLDSCDNSGIDKGTDCNPDDNSCIDKYDPKNLTKPWTNEEYSALLQCRATGCTPAKFSRTNWNHECTKVN
jgi:hypothetical protein